MQVAQRRKAVVPLSPQIDVSTLSDERVFLVKQQICAFFYCLSACGCINLCGQCCCQVGNGSGDELELEVKIGTGDSW